MLDLDAGIAKRVSDLLIEPERLEAVSSDFCSERIEVFLLLDDPDLTNASGKEALVAPCLLERFWRVSVRPDATGQPPSMSSGRRGGDSSIGLACCTFPAKLGLGSCEMGTGEVCGLDAAGVVETCS